MAFFKGLWDALIDDKFIPYYDKMIECISNVMRSKK